MRVGSLPADIADYQNTIGKQLDKISRLEESATAKAEALKGVIAGKPVDSHLSSKLSHKINKLHQILQDSEIWAGSSQESQDFKKIATRCIQRKIDFLSKKQEVLVKNLERAISFNPEKSQKIAEIRALQGQNFENHLKEILAGYTNDKDVILEAVKKSKWALQYASQKLRKDPEVVMAAIKQDPAALLLASDQLRRNKRFIVEAFRKRVESFAYAADHLREDKEFVLKLVKRNNSVLPYVLDELKSDILKSAPQR